MSGDECSAVFARSRWHTGAARVARPAYSCSRRPAASETATRSRLLHPASWWAGRWLSPGGERCTRFSAARQLLFWRTRTRRFPWWYRNPGRAPLTSKFPWRGTVYARRPAFDGACSGELEHVGTPGDTDILGGTVATCGFPGAGTMYRPEAPSDPLGMRTAPHLGGAAPRRREGPCGTAQALCARLATWAAKRVRRCSVKSSAGVVLISGTAIAVPATRPPVRTGCSW